MLVMSYEVLMICKHNYNWYTAIIIYTL